MLILSRRAHESIIIGDRLVTITILGIVGNQVRVGIDAPKRINIHREEIFKKIEMERSEDEMKNQGSVTKGSLTNGVA